MGTDTPRPPASPTPSAQRSARSAGPRRCGATRALHAAARIAAGQRGLITLAQARRCGVDATHLRRVLRRGDWRRVLHGVYAIAELQQRGDERERIRTAALAAQLALGPVACAGGETAARLWGLQGLRPWDGRRVHMVMPAETRQLPGVTLHRWDIGRGDVTAVDGIRVTSPDRTLRDTLLGVDRDTGVCLLDSALCQGFVRGADLPRLEAANRGRRGCRRVRGWRELADGRAESPLETRVRLVCVGAGLPPTDLQHPFFDEHGRLVAVADFWWADRLLIGEADGIGPHSTADALARDRRRQNALQTRYPGIRVVRFTWADLDRPGYIRSTIAAAGGC